MSAPLRPVVKAAQMGGVVAINRGFRSRWWDLTLSCGHTTERSFRYQPGGERGWGRLWHGRPDSEALPPPKRVRCHECARVGEQ